MAIRDRDRKLLWGRSASRCAICREELIEPSTAGDRESVVGEEAHIVARSPGGPRGNHVDEHRADGYENLILLCPRHHKMVDDQPIAYGVEVLRSIKSLHEGWVTTMLNVRQPMPSVELPMVPSRLVNRHQELSKLDQIEIAARSTSKASIVVLSGMHGVGKSALGAHWLVNSKARFFTHLVGDLSSRATGGPVDPSAILIQFLDDLGVPEAAIPSSFAAQQTLFHRLTSTLRLAVLLDGVDYPAQATPLIPRGEGSMVLITSNNRLEELLYDGATPIAVEPLTIGTSRQLLLDIVGPDRLDTDAEAASRIIEICDGLPIALRVCGARLASRDRLLPLSEFVRSIEEATDRLAALSGSGNYAINAVFDVAYDTLAEDARLVYRRMGLHPAGDITIASMAALCDLPTAATEAALRQLDDAHLVQRTHPETYRVHDLIRIHARNRNGSDDTLQLSVDATRRLVEWVCAAVSTADRAVFADRLRLNESLPSSPTELPNPADSRSAAEWFKANLQVVVGALRDSVALGLDDTTWKLAEACWPFCYNHKLYDLWFEAYEAGAQAGERLANKDVVARMNSALARAYADQGDHQQAARRMAAALSAVESSSHQILPASVAEFHALICVERGDTSEALREFRRARELYRRADRARGIAIQDYHIGKCLVQLGAPADAIDPIEAAISTFHHLGDDIIGARALRLLGVALTRIGRQDDADESLHRALDAMNRLGLKHDQAVTFEALAELAEDRANVEAAHSYRTQAFERYQDIGHPRATMVRAAPRNEANTA